MTDQLPIFFPVEVPGGSINLRDIHSDGRTWHFSARGARGLKIVAPDRGGVLAESTPSGLVIWFRFGSGKIDSLGAWNPPVVSVLRLEITGLSASNFETEVVQRLFDHMAERSEGYITLHGWAENTQRLVRFTSAENNQFQIEDGEGNSRAETFVSQHWIHPTSGSRSPSRKPMLQVIRRSPIIWSTSSSLPNDVGFNLALIHEDRTARFYYDVPEFFDRLQDNEKLISGETANFEFSSRGGRAIQRYLKVFGVPEADADQEAFESPSHHLFNIKGGHSQIDLTIPFRTPELPGGEETQVFVVPPAIMRLEPNIRALTPSNRTPNSSQITLIDEVSISNSATPLPVQWKVFPNTFMTPASVNTNLSTQFVPGSGHNLHESLALQWDTYREIYSLEQTRANPNLILAHQNKYVAFKILPNYLTFLQTQLGLLAVRRSALVSPLYSNKTSPYRHKLIDVMGLFTFMASTASYSGTNEVLRNLSQDVQSGSGPIFHEIEGVVTATKTELSERVQGRGEDSIRSILCSIYFQEQFEAAGGAKKAEILSDLILFLGSHQEGTDLLIEMGAQTMFLDTQPPRADGMPHLYSYENFKIIWSVVTSSVGKLGEVVQYATIHSMRREAAELIRRGAWSDASRQRVIRNIQRKFSEIELSVIEDADGRLIVRTLDQTPGNVRRAARARVLQRSAIPLINIGMSLVSLYENYISARSSWTRLGAVLNTIDFAYSTGSYVTELMSLRAGRSIPGGALTNIAVTGQRGFMRLSPGGVLSVGVGAYNIANLVMDSENFRDRGDTGAQVGTYVSILGESLSAVGGVAAMTGAGAPAGLAIMAIGFLVSLAGSAATSIVRRSEFRNVIEHTILGAQHDERSTIYNDIWGKPLLQLRRTLSAVYPITINSINISSITSLDITPSLAEFGSLVYIEFVDADGDLVARFQTPIFAGNFGRTDNFLNLPNPDETFPTRITSSLRGVHSTDSFSTSIRVIDDNLINIRINFDRVFHPELQNAARAFIYVSPNRAINHSDDSLRTFTFDRSVLPLPDGEGGFFVWPKLDWIEERPDLTLLAIGSN